MKKVYFIISLSVVMLTASKNAAAQYYFFDGTYFDNPMLYEAGISVNGMNCLTDIGGKHGVGTKFLKDLNLGFTHLSAGIFASVTFRNEVGLRLEGTFGKVSAHDEVLVGLTDEAKNRYNRNLAFSSRISELSAIFEVHPLFIFIDWAAKDQAPPRFSPYLLGGVGYFSFNPQTKIGNRTIDLRPLHTEGEGFAEYPDRPEYSLNQINIPLGGGIKYELNPLMNLRAEVVYRKTFTDYLDDLSTTYIDPALFDKYLTPQKAMDARLLYDKQLVGVAGIDGKRGTSTNNDAYLSFNLKVSVIIGRERMKK